ncbi:MULTISPECIES: chromate efflux transporter [unclassified Paenibacillus]|uniref:chromate efflux transporter n=1 Tax=unclassified Paenibacillus TaxID=185978 RepID=UPI001AE2F19E|nr:MULTISPECIES: chromate efflux transporter [unclassified Paenibacillus]MBP1155042.1 chromate transporter [Paenibacillus sp. PvP091]MBP1169575.1 chromate transporter [Paenibacillus sp. PvR098]MBP2440603.1 chromate transporter [Paenibacillus sp. PvP052]
MSSSASTNEIVEAPKSKAAALMEILRVSVKLGVTSFGGPIAHLGYFRDEYVNRRKWMDERAYADLVALSQFLPGPASSQVGIGIGVIRGGLLGGLIAWLGFTLPSVLALVVFAYALQGFGLSGAGWIHGLKLVAVAVVAQAVLGMGRQLAPDRARASVAILTAAVTLLWQTALTQVLLIAAAALLGAWWYRRGNAVEPDRMQIPVSRTSGAVFLILFAVLLLGLPILRQLTDNVGVAMFDSFYRAGSLVFGGGHVVLPLLEREMVPLGWISKEDFLAGYGAAQAIPGPMFTFASYVGTMAGGLAGAITATIAIFLPAFLLIIGALPFWNALRAHPRMQGALTGMNAAVVGILLAALYDPIWTTAVLRPVDFAFVAVLFGMLVFWKVPAWYVVVVGALMGAIIPFLSA